GCQRCAATPRARPAPALICLPTRPFCAIIPVPPPILTCRWLEVNLESLGRMSRRDTANPSSPDRPLAAHLPAAPLRARRTSAPRPPRALPQNRRARHLLRALPRGPASPPAVARRAARPLARRADRALRAAAPLVADRPRPRSPEPQRAVG